MASIGQVPVAGFNASPTTGCAPLAISFTDQSTGNPTAWQWDLGNGTVSTQQSPTTTYFNPGTYTVTLTVTNANGSNTVSKMNYITVNEKPAVDFTVSDSAGCFPLRANFTDLSSAGSGSIVSWEWDFGDGSTSTAQNPFHIFSTSGNYTVTLKVTNSGGCVKVLSKPMYIQVSSGVTVDFNNSATSLCHPPETVNFTNLSTGPGVLSYQWNFGEGGTSVLTNPSHTYNIGGSFDVSLVVQSSLGCVDTLVKTAAVVVNDVQVSFNMPDSVCTKEFALCQNTSAPSPVSLYWDFGDGTSSTQNAPYKKWSNPGIYQVKLICYYATCQDSLTKPIKVSARPSVDFTANDTINCKAPFVVNFQDLSTGGVSWSWDFGDGGTSALQNPTHTYNSPGSFTVKLVVTNSSNCQDSLIKTQYINIAKPVVNINGVPVEGCVPFTLNPTPNVTAIDGVASYSWDFGDGGTSALQNPSHTYPSQGTYTVKLFITTNDGCIDSAVVANAVRVGTIPTANFTAVPLSQCVGQSIQFTDLSVPADRWLWDFGDGNSASVQNPLHIYADTGYYSIKLTVWNNGCSTSVTKNNFVTALPPVARFNPFYNCNNKKQVSFTDQSVLPQTWAWDFGDGATSALQNPVHTYAAFGSYVVTLTVTNASCSNTITHTVSLFTEVPDFLPADDTICKSQTALFVLNGVTQGNISSTSWYFGDGSSTVTGPGVIAITHNYTAAGSYSVKIVITDVRGCTDSITKPNVIRVWGPAANYSVAPVAGCKGMTATFTDLSTTDAVHPLTNWLWDFGDGQSQNYTAPPFTHQYDTSGTFFPRLRITDSYGCSELFSGPSIFITQPKANFISADTLTCVGKNVVFSDSSVGNTLSYAWSFGDGNTSTQINPITVYAADGNYNIKLVVSDINGCKDSLLLNGYIKVRTTIPSFTVNDSLSSCSPFEVVFTNTSINTVAQTWDFGDGTSSTLSNPSHYYSTPATYNIKLITTGPGGCTDSAFKKVTLYPSTATLVYAPLVGCSPLSVNFHVSTAGPVTYLWDLNDGSTLTTTDSNLIYNYLLPGNFIPKVILEDQTGCLIPVTGIDTIKVTKSDVNFGVSDSVLCDAGTVNFSDSTVSNGSISKYQWSFGDGGTSVLQNPSHFYSAPGLYTVQLIVSTTNGCTDTLIKTNFIKVVSSPVISITGNNPVCMPGVLSFKGIQLQPDTSALSWNWSFGNGNTSSAKNPVPQRYDTAGNYPLQLIVTNSSSCADTVTDVVVIYSLPLVDAGPDKIIPVGTSVTLSTTGSAVTTYLWSPGTSLNCTSCPTPVASPKNNITYRVKVTDINGCVSYDDVTVIVTCSGENVFIPNTFSPNNDGANDIFYPRGKGLYRIQSMQVFNRWGEIVFSKTNFFANNPSDGWNGMYKNKPANTDVYTYIIEIICDNSSILSFKGNITLIQ